MDKFIDFTIRYDKYDTRVYMIDKDSIISIMPDKYYTLVDNVVQFIEGAKVTYVVGCASYSVVVMHTVEEVINKIKRINNDDN